MYLSDNKNIDQKKTFIDTSKFDIVRILLIITN